MPENNFFEQALNAVENDQPKLLAKYLNKTVYEQDHKGESLVLYAARLKKWSCVEIMVQRSELISAKDKGVIILSAIEANNLHIAKILLDTKPLESCHLSGDHALHIAVNAQNRKAVQLLVQYKGFTLDVNRQNHTPIVHAAVRRQWDFVIEIAEGRHTDEVDAGCYGQAMHLVLYAASDGYHNARSAFGVLLQAGAARALRPSVDVQGNNSLHLAVIRKDEFLVALLLSHHFPTDKLNNAGKLASQLNPEIYKKALLRYQKKEMVHISNALIVLTQRERQQKKHLQLGFEAINFILAFLSKEYNPQVENLNVQEARFKKLSLKSFFEDLSSELHYTNTAFTPALSQFEDTIRAINAEQLIVDNSTALTYLKKTEEAISYLLKHSSPLVIGLLKKNKLGVNLSQSKAPYLVLREIQEDIISKTVQQQWHMDLSKLPGTFEYEGKNYILPKEVYQILALIKQPGISDQNKLDQIENIIPNQGFLASLFGIPSELAQWNAELTQKIKQSKNKPCHTKALEQIQALISGKTQANSWVFGGLLGLSTYKVQGISIPKGVKQILDILQKDTLFDFEKLQAIVKITREKQNWRGASLLSLGLSMRSTDTKAFYKKITDLISKVDFNPSSYSYLHEVLVTDEVGAGNISSSTDRVPCQTPAKMFLPSDPHSKNRAGSLTLVEEEEKREVIALNEV